MSDLVIATHKELTEIILRLRAENEKLRAALKQCDEAMAWCLGGEPIDTLMIEARRAAADALKETGDE